MRITKLWQPVIERSLDGIAMGAPVRLWRNPWWNGNQALEMTNTNDKNIKSQKTMKLVNENTRSLLELC